MHIITRIMSNFLYSSEAVATTGFVAGMVWSIDTNPNIVHNILNKPLTTIMSGVFGGYVIMIGSALVESLLPKNITPIIPLALMASTGYYVVQSLKCGNNSNVVLPKASITFEFKRDDKKTEQSTQTNQ